MIWACALVIAGGFAAQHSRLPLSSDICILLIVASVLMLSRRSTRYPGCFVFGLGWFLLAGQEIVDARLQQQFVSDSLLTDVRIVDFPRKTGKSLVMVVAPLDDPRLPPRSRVSWFEPAIEPALGDVWRLELRLKRPRGLSNPGVFDREAWLFRNEIHATGYVVDGKRNRQIASGTESVVDTLRRDFIARSALAAPSPASAAVLAAIGVGARHNISRAQWNRYAVSGTSHLMAISGLHIGLAASAAFLFARVLASVLPRLDNAHLASILVALVCASAYGVVSGLGVPAQRATLMLLVAGVTALRRRRIAVIRTVAQAAVIVFVMHPVATMAPGFHLSFGAVLLLVWMTGIQQPRSERRRIFLRIGDRLRQLFRVQVFLLFGLMPLTVLLFQRIAPLALPVNLVAVPLFSFVTVPFTLIGLVLGDGSGPVGHTALTIAAHSIRLIEVLVARAAGLPFVDLTIIEVRGFLGLAVFLPALMALLPKGWPGRHVALLAVAALLLQPPIRPPEDCVDTHVLDVGQGLATVLQTHRRTMVFDTGASFRGGGSVAELVIVPFLKSRGLRQIDWMIVSHADLDHSGGVAALAEYAVIADIRAGEPLPESGLTATPCKAGQSWDDDGVRFRVLHPPATSPLSGNDSSCVVHIETGQHAILLTGDIEAVAERDLVAARPWGRIDVVVVPHHGSLTSSSVAFVNAVAPKIAIVSAGFNNRWGFPKAEVVARWSAVGATILNTAPSGAVSFRLCRESGLGAPRLDRHERRRFWRDAGGQAPKKRPVSQEFSAPALYISFFRLGSDFYG